MLPDGAIEVRHLWKRFRRDHKGSLMRDQLRRLNARLHRRDPGWTWALREIDFSVAPGESIGIVGANGSGKTTLLRILSGVMYQYAGTVEVAGRVGALIEVRAGIHPELTGRENIFIYGTLLGLNRKAIARRFDDIVQFAELENAIYRQVKHYSSGMQTRLGFAVAAYLDPAVLIVDEVLSVGDAAFQQRCLDRMREVLAMGTTLLFVSHDLATVEATCTRGIWLDQGVMVAAGPTPEVMTAYRSSVEEVAALTTSRSGDFEIVEAEVTGPGGGLPHTQEALDIRLVLAKRSDDPDSWTNVVVGVTEGTATPIFVLRHRAELRNGVTEVRCRIPNLPLPRGRFFVWATVGQKLKDTAKSIAWQPVAKFDVVGDDLDPTPQAVVRLSPVHVRSEWNVSQANGAGGTSPPPAPEPARDGISAAEL